VFPLCVIAGLVPAIHAFNRSSKSKTWMPGQEGEDGASHLSPGHDGFGKC
jgi:hypothetical protein